MSVRRSRTTRLAILGTIFVTVLVAGCATRDPSVVPSVTPTRSIGPVPTASVAPTRTLAPELDVDALPRASFDPVRLTAVCAPESDLLQRDPPRRAIFCSDSRGDALSVGLAAIQTVVDGPIDRLYLEWPTCPATGCTDDDFQTATVVGWSNGNAYSTVVDARLLRVPVPTPEDSIEWPAFGPSEAPPVQRPTIKNAPAEIADRTPYPFCGRAELGDPPEVDGCFRDAVLAGRPAEMIERVYGTEGGVILRLYRFAGHGAIIGYQHGEGRWIRQFGTMLLSNYEAHWDMGPWDQPPKVLR